MTSLKQDIIASIDTGNDLWSGVVNKHKCVRDFSTKYPRIYIYFQFFLILWSAINGAIFFISKKFIIAVLYTIAVVATLSWFGIISKVEAKTPNIPRIANIYKADLIRSARFEWGLEAPVAVFAAQIHTESNWKSDAVSPAGAEGLTQFMPATAKWLPEVMPQVGLEAGKPAPFNPVWAIRALCAYNYWHYKRIEAVNYFERMAFTLSAYNGGLGWVYRDKKKAQANGLNPFQYFDSVEKINAGRHAAAFRENRSYPDIILNRRQFIYASWGGVIEIPLETIKNE